VILLADLKMLGQMINALREQGDLHVCEPVSRSCTLNSPIVFALDSILISV
jgi:hypothetical protein